MSARTDGGPAFPSICQSVNGIPIQSGMTLRDYLAAKAMNGWFAGSYQQAPAPTGVSIEEAREIMCRNFYTWADAMLAAREAVKPVEQPAREVLSDDLSRCQRALMDAGKPYPKTCPVCGLGGKCKREGGAA